MIKSDPMYHINLKKDLFFPVEKKKKGVEYHHMGSQFMASVTMLMTIKKSGIKAVNTVIFTEK